MSKHDEIAEIIETEIKPRFPQWHPDAATVKAYVESLMDLDVELARAACIHTASTIKPYGEAGPSIHELRQAALYLVCQAQQIPSAEEAWAQINTGRPMARMRRCDASHAIHRLCDGPHTSEREYWADIEKLSEHEDNCAICGWKIPEQFTHPFVAHVARLMGWPDRFFTGELGVDRAHFIRAYNQQVERLLANAVMLPQVRGYIEAHRGKALEVSKGVKLLAGRLTK